MPPYTTQLRAGLAMVEETRLLLDLWDEGMEPIQFYSAALDSGCFPNMSARRLRNLIEKCFSTRYLREPAAAPLLKKLVGILKTNEFSQVLFFYTCRANEILGDFVREVYWDAYSSGRQEITNAQAQQFVRDANANGLTSVPWSDQTIRRVASGLTGCCGDFGLLENGPRSKRRILPFRIEPRVTTILAYDLHFAGLGDNQVLASEDWGLFGLERDDVLTELKRQSLQGKFIVQTAGDISKISWPCKSIGELVDVIADS